MTLDFLIMSFSIRFVLSFVGPFIPINFNVVLNIIIGLATVGKCSVNQEMRL